MVRKLRRSLESFGTKTTERKSFNSFGKENEGSSSTIENVNNHGSTSTIEDVNNHGSTSTIKKDNHGSTSTIETVFTVEETKAKENSLRRRVSFMAN